MSQSWPEADVLVRLVESICGFRRHCAAYWPGAQHFLLVEIRRDGTLTGEAFAVCPACVRTAASAALARSLGGAPTLLDVAGGDGPAESACCFCGEFT